MFDSRDVVFSYAEVGQLDKVPDVVADLPDPVEPEVQRLEARQLVDDLWNLKQQAFD